MQRTRPTWPAIVAMTVAFNACFTACFLRVATAAPFVPNDPYFYTDNVPGFPGQWHLDKQTSGAVVDVNIRGAWERGLTGQGVVIGIVDGGVELTHPDLIDNARPDLSWNFITNGPETSLHSHGMAVAGVAAARGGNGIGTTGAAPHAQIASLEQSTGNPLFSNEAPQYEARTAAAIRFKPDQIHVKNYSVGWPFQLINMPEIDLAFRESAEAGTLNVVIAHNYRLGTDVRSSKDANQNSFTHNPDVIVVAGLGSNGKFAAYSNYGASVTVTSPTLSSSQLNGPDNWGITTTDRTGAAGYNGTAEVLGEDLFPDENYTTEFSGTSSAGPLVSGIIALTKEAQPNLTVRMAKHLLARTSRIVDPTDATPMGGWQTNAAGIHFNNNYGFGLIDADALTLAATEYIGVTSLQTESTGLVNVGVTVPENGANGVVRNFTFLGGQTLEEMVVRLVLADSINSILFLGDLSVELTSPSGMKSILMFPDDDNQHLIDLNAFPRATLDWTFTSNAFWGEDAAGEWSLAMYDRVLSSGGTAEGRRVIWTAFEMTARYGSLIPVPEPTGICLAMIAGFTVVLRNRVRACGRNC